MKKIALIILICLSLFFASCGQETSEPEIEEPVLLSGMVVLPEGAILNTEDRSVSYSACYSEIDLWGYRLYEVKVDWLYDFSGMSAELNGEELEIVPLSDSYFIAEKKMNAKEIETLRDKASEVIYEKEGKVSNLLVTDPLILADRFVTMEAIFGESGHASMLLYLNDDSDWELKEYLPKETLSRPAYEHIPYINPNEMMNGRTPYSIKVNILENCVTVYTFDEVGEYTKPVKAFVCSAGREGHESPTGDYHINDFRPLWCYMIDGSYGKYVSGWRSGGYLFHTICYSGQRPDLMFTEEYNLLGSNASLGCIRLQTIDAKWIYKNCVMGTPVTIYEDEDPGPLGKPEKLVPFISPEMENGWDPTDPKPNNPWRTRL